MVVHLRSNKVVHIWVILGVGKGADRRTTQSPLEEGKWTKMRWLSLRLLAAAGFSESDLSYDIMKAVQRLNHKQVASNLREVAPL